MQLAFVSAQLRSGVCVCVQCAPRDLGGQTASIHATVTTEPSAVLQTERVTAEGAGLDSFVLNVGFHTHAQTHIIINVATLC